MSAIWIIGRRVALPNGHHYAAEPYIAFETNAQAQAACDMIEKVSGERPMIMDAAFYRKGETSSPSKAERGKHGGEARAASLSAARRSEIASRAANARWNIPQ